MVRTSGPALVAVFGVGALAGGLVGALAAGRIGSSRPSVEALAARPAADPDPPPQASDDAGVELLLGTLIEEVRALRTSLGSARQSAPSLDDPSDLVSAIEELTGALQRASSTGAGSLALGRGLTTIDWPEGAARVDLLLERQRIEDETQRVRPYLLWNYQQVLDHFGPPSAIWNDENWMYEDPASGEQVTLHFESGLLINIY